MSLEIAKTMIKKKKDKYFSNDILVPNNWKNNISKTMDSLEKY